MKFLEKTNEVVGHLTVEVVDINSKEVIDKYEHKNMIMSDARYTIMNAIAGFNNRHINKFVMGTKGTKNDDLLTPKTSVEGFISTRTELFSEESEDFTYNVSFEPTTVGGYADVTEDDVGAGSTIKIDINATTVNYVIEISGDAANNGSQVPYTEFALYTGDKIFSMRCTNAKIKDSASMFKITWSLTF